MRPEMNAGWRRRAKDILCEGLAARRSVHDLDDLMWPEGWVRCGTVPDHHASPQSPDMHRLLYYNTASGAWDAASLLVDCWKWTLRAPPGGEGE